MNPGTWLLIIALTILVGSYLARPLIERKGFATSPEEKHLSVLQAEKEQMLSILQELDMDFAMGKIEPDDYQAQRSELIRRGASILRQMDQLSGSDVADPRGILHRGWGGPEALEVEIEQAVSRRRQKQQIVSTGCCSQCGNPILAGDRFCARCGARVRTGEVEA